MPPLRPPPAPNVSRPRLPAPGPGDPLPGYSDIVLFEAVSRKGSAGCGGLSLRGGDAAYLVISLFVAPGPVETVPVSCPRLPRVLVAVELVAPFRRGQIWTFHSHRGRGKSRLAPRSRTSSSPAGAEHQVVRSTPLVSPTASS